MKKSILFSLFFMLFACIAFAQDEDAELEELDAPPSLDEILEKPKPIKYESFDGFVDASFGLYDKVIQVRKDGEANGWPEQGVKVSRFFKEYAKLAKETVEMARGLKAMPKLKIPFAMKNFAVTKKALSHSQAHLKYMRAQFSEEEWAQIEAQADAAMEEAETDSTATGDGGQR